MKKTPRLVREIEHAQARIAELREQQARTARDLSYWTGMYKNKVMELVGATLEGLDLSQVSIHDLVASLSRLGEDAHHRGDATLAGEANIEVFVKYGRNASAANRRFLEAAGLHWHGRQAGWVGVVAAAQLNELRRAFGSRVERPEQADAEGDPHRPQDAAAEAVSGHVEAVATSAGKEHGEIDTLVAEAQTVSPTTALRSSSFGFPLRRSTVT